MGRQRCVTLQPRHLHADEAILSNRGHGKKKVPGKGRRRSHSEGDYQVDMSALAKAMEAAKKGDLQTIKNLHRYSRTDFGVQDYDGRTVLHLAVEYDHLEVVRYLVNDCGAPLNVHDRWQQYPLKTAKEKGFNEIVKFLESCDKKEKNSQLDDTTTDMEAIAYKLCDAASKGNLTCLKEFYKKGVNLAQADYDGRTALHLACNEGHTDIVTFLLGALPKHCVLVVDRFGNTPLGDAQKCKNSSIVEKLNKCLYAVPQEVSITKNPEASQKVAIRDSLLKAIKKEDEQEVQKTLSQAQTHGHTREVLLSTEEQCNQWRKAANLATTKGSTSTGVDASCTKLVEVICHAKHSNKMMAAVLEVERNFGDAPSSDIMEGLIRNEKNKELKLFLEKTKADPNVTGDGGRCPLYTAIEVGNKVAVELLLKCQVELNQVAKQYQFSPLIYLIRNPKLNAKVVREMLQLLLTGGANPNLNDADHGLYPIHHAIQSPRTGGEIAEMIKVLLKHKALIDSQDRAGLTALQYAAGEATHRPNQRLNERDRFRLVNLLAENGASLDHSCSSNGNTALHYAVKSGSRLVTDCLLALGANCRLKNGSNYTAAEFAPEGSQMRRILINREKSHVGRVQGPAAKAFRRSVSLSPPQTKIRVRKGGTRVPIEHTEECSLDLCTDASKMDSDIPTLIVTSPEVKPTTLMVPEPSLDEGRPKANTNHPRTSAQWFNLPAKRRDKLLKSAMNFISERVGSEYPKLVRKLNKDMDILKMEALLDDIKYSFERDGLEEMVHQCLRRWRERVGHAASLEALMTALHESNMPRLERAFEHRFSL